MVVGLALVGCGGGGGSGDDIDAAPTPDGRVDAPPSATPVTYTVVGLDGAPETGDVVLVSDNDGPFAPVTGTNGVYQFMIAGPRYAIAHDCDDPANQYSEAYLYYLTVDDTTDLHDLGCRSTTATVTVSGAVTGVGAAQRAAITTGAGFAFPAAGATSYTLTQPPLTVDVVGRLIPDVTTSVRPTQRLLIERDVVVPASGLVHDLDFTADGVVPETHTFTVTGANPGASDFVAVSFQTGRLYGYGLESTLVTTADYHALPAAQMRAGDLVKVIHSSYEPGQSRSVSATVDAPADLTGTLPAAYAPSDPTIAGTAPARLAGTLPHVDGATVYEVDASVVDEASSDISRWTQIYTARYASDQAIDYTFPDLSGIGGWNVALGTGEIEWTEGVGSSTLTGAGLGYPLPLVNGDVGTYADKSGTLTP